MISPLSISPDSLAFYVMVASLIVIRCLIGSPQYNLSVESNQNVESKRQTVESKMRK